MSNHLTHMKKVRLIIRLYTEGLSKQTISEKTGCSRNTVKKYIRQYIALGMSYEELNRFSNTSLEQLFKTEAPVTSTKLETLRSYFPEMEKALKQKGITREYLWKKYLSEHPEGYRLSQFKEYYNRWRKQSGGVMHIEHKSGDKMYVDYAGNRLEIVNPDTGEVRQVEVFVAILGASQLTYVDASFSQQKEDFIQSCENALLYFGGVPQAIVTDNLKSAVIKSDRYEPTLNEAFRDFTLHYGISALPAGPYKPRHKALAEGMVKIIYRVIYPAIRMKSYTNLEDLNRDILTELDKLNNQLMKGRPYSRRMLFEETEREALQALPARRFEIRHKKVATVMKNNHVSLSVDKHYYSVPYEYIGKKVKLFYNQIDVEIYYQYEKIATHKRDFRPYRYTSVPEHLASSHKYITEWTPEVFIERAGKIGDDTCKYIQRVLEKPQHAEQAYRSCQGILNLAKRVGNERLNKACARADYFGEWSYYTVKTILERKLDSTDPENEVDIKTIPLHTNIRGKRYYK
ncbi:MAG: IS21 family transposase [Deltaproteobacteria bacterium]|nr:IS21 family transposase [Deltaproteobacteria bacterium]